MRNITKRAGSTLAGIALAAALVAGGAGAAYAYPGDPSGTPGTPTGPTVTPGVVEGTASATPKVASGGKVTVVSGAPAGVAVTIELNGKKATGTTIVAPKIAGKYEGTLTYTTSDGVTYVKTFDVTVGKDLGKITPKVATKAKKGKNISTSGKLATKLKNVQVEYLYSKKKTSGFVHLKTTKTDKKGKYETAFKIKKKGTYYVKIVVKPSLTVFSSSVKIVKITIR